MAPTMNLTDLKRHAWTFLVLYICIPSCLTLMAWSYGLLGTCGSICYEVLSDVGLTGLQAYVMEGKDTLLRCEKCCLGNWDNEFHKNIGVPFVVAFLMIYVIRNKVAQVKKHTVTELKKKK
ncbi:hypothetical protein TrLO_g10093 [Triparma laevis f. longispina]|uniref:Uncharacterized protein n=1 Tax=Triparma laevis f. longispina TaxID=1714387 RepID=A0A9W7FFF3_9STRA|nr:hypothetical protein TrLO_g10093 [Triparma laevis f. longispina]